MTYFIFLNGSHYAPTLKGTYLGKPVLELIEVQCGTCQHDYATDVCQKRLDESRLTACERWTL